MPLPIALNRVVSSLAAEGIATESGGMKVRVVLRILKEDGWIEVARRGSHRQFKHSLKTGRVTVSGKQSDDLAPGTLKSILRQAGLDRNRGSNEIRNRH